MREAGRAAQAEDIARSSEIPDVLPAPAQAEVRGRESGDATRARLDRVWESHAPPGRQSAQAGVSLEANIPRSRGSPCPGCVCVRARACAGVLRYVVFSRASPPYAGLEAGPLSPRDPIASADFPGERHTIFATC